MTQRAKDNARGKGAKTIGAPALAREFWPVWLSRLLGAIVPAGLSARLLALTIGFVLLSEVLIYVPSIATHRITLLQQHLEAAQLAALALEARSAQDVTAPLAEELLENAGVLSVVLQRNEQHTLFLRPGALPAQPQRLYDLSNARMTESIYDSFALLFSSHPRVIAIRGVPQHEGGVAIQAVLDEGPIQSALITYSKNILGVSIVISLLTASFVFAAIHFLLVRPIKRIERSMALFRQNPLDPQATVRAGARRDEVGRAERELKQMQVDVRSALNQKARLAALGTAVSKINHDLRNMLSSAQLIVDRLGKSEDPQVRNLAPRLVAAIDRAVALAGNTLRYGRAEEAAPRPLAIDLFALADEVALDALARSDGRIRFSNRVPEGFEIFADPEQLFRILLNLVRNAAQAIEHGSGVGDVTIAARATTSAVFIDVIDNGPGVPIAARQRLFEPFSSVSRDGGTGLGLAIASELVKAHGGEISLTDTGPTGTSFTIRLPQPD